jgi:SAM-dependent methyltransferase
MTSSPDQAFFRDADPYERFMGRYSRPLAHELVRVARVAPGEQVLDVGCGTGALTGLLAELVGSEHVGGADPSEPFVEACRKNVPGADVRVGPAEALPFDDEAFDCTLAQLVFHFVDDPTKALGEMARVTRRGGRVGACVWDMTGGMTMLATYWQAAREIDASAPGEASRFGVAPGQLADLWREGGLQDVEAGAITVSSRYRDFDELWQSFLAGIGPAGAHASSLDDATRDAVRDAYHRRIGSPAGPFELDATAWYAVASV